MWGAIGGVAVALIVGLYLYHSSTQASQATAEVDRLTTQRDSAEAQIRNLQDLEVRESTAATNERAAKLEVKAAQLQLQLLKQGSRASLLYGYNRAKLVNELNKFAGQRYVLLYCNTCLNAYSLDNEAMSLVLLLRATFNEAGWKELAEIATDGGGQGVWVNISPDADAKTRSTAEALRLSLQNVRLDIGGNRVWDQAATKYQSDVIVVTVLSHLR